MKQFNLSKGTQGETIAADYLVKNGFKIIEKNFRTKWGEIDLIASKEGKLIFVEVKLKVGDRFGSPEEMIGYAKLRQVKRAAQLYLLTKKEIAAKYEMYRIDAVCIVMNTSGDIERISHYENI